jgi:hypothetical protein
MADDTKQILHQYFLKATQKRLTQAIPGSDETAFAQLSLAAVLNLLFLLRGEWGSLGDFITTQRALRAVVGDDLLWSEPQKSTPASAELVH